MRAVVKYYRDAPEQLGLHEEDIARLRSKRDRLADEKRARERRLRELKAAVEVLWEKLSVEEHERKAFMNRNRGCGVRQINEFRRRACKAQRAEAAKPAPLRGGGALQTAGALGRPLLL